MKTELTLKKSYSIKAPASKVWDALTKPELIKQYFFGTETEATWKKGSPIFFRGEWEGKPYEDKGTIIDIVPEKLIHYTYWSSFFGTEDKPENYKNIRYELSSSNGETILTISQDGFESQEKVDHSEGNWDGVIGGLKKLVE